MAGLDEISIRVLFPFKLLKPGIFWLVVGHKKCPRPIIPEPLGFLLQNLVLLYRNTSIKRPGRLLKFQTYRRGVYSRGRLKEGGVYYKILGVMTWCAETLEKELLKRKELFTTSKLKF